MTDTGRLGRRLDRILRLLPYAIKHPGTTVGELAKRLGVEESDVLDDLTLVFMCGLPGYGPGDLIDVDIEDGRVYVRMADYFGESFRLTPLEGLVLYAGGTAIAQLPGMEEVESLHSALAKLRGALGAGSDEVGELRVILEGGPIDHVRVLRAALERSTRVRIEYLSQQRGLSSREVDPWGLIATLGRLYLVGFDHLTDEERTFRVDRMKSVEALETQAEIPEDFDPERYGAAFVGREGQPVISFEISPRAAAWFEDYYPVRSAEERPDGWRRVELYSSGDRWAANLLLLLGSEARALQPASLLDATRRQAAAIAALYGA